MRNVFAQVGTYRSLLGPADVVDALFATASYRLEPDGFATRFPVVMNELQAGRLAADRAPNALAELSAIGHELAGIPAARVVWRLDDLERRDAGGKAVNAKAYTAHEYLVAADGRPLVEALVDAVDRCRRTGEPLVLGTNERARDRRSGALLAAAGTAWAVASLVLFPTTIVTPSSPTLGVPLWSLGLYAVLLGAGLLAASRWPRVRVALRRRPTLAGLAFAVVLLAVFALTRR